MLITHKILPLFSLITFSIYAVSLLSSSFYEHSSTTIGFKLAAVIDFKHVFWSIRDHTTVSHSGLSDLSVIRVIVIDIPVAKGKTIRSLTKFMPHYFLRQFFVIAAVSLTTRLDPIAFG